MAVGPLLSGRKSDFHAVRAVDSVPVGAVEALFIVASPPGSEASKISVKEGVEGERYKEIEGER